MKFIVKGQRQLKVWQECRIVVEAPDEDAAIKAVIMGDDAIEWISDPDSWEENVLPEWEGVPAAD